MESVKDYMDKKAVAQVLEQIAAFLELKSENPFRVRAFRTAARALTSFQGDLRQSLDDGSHVFRSTHWRHDRSAVGGADCGEDRD